MGFARVVLGAYEMKKRIILSALLIFSFCSIGNALTLSDIRTNVRLIVKDSNSNRQRFSDANLNSLINVGQREASGASYAIVKSTSISLTANGTNYTLPTDLITIKRVQLDNLDLRQASPEGLDSDPGGKWEDQTGRPKNYYQLFSNPSDVSVFPVPSTTSHLGTLEVFYYAFADDLSSDSDTPFNAISRYTIYHDILTYYAAWRLLLIKGEVEKAATYQQLYETRLLALINRANEQPNYRPSFSSVRE